MGVVKPRRPRTAGDSWALVSVDSGVHEAAMVCNRDGSFHQRMMVRDVPALCSIALCRDPFTIMTGQDSQLLIDRVQRRSLDLNDDLALSALHIRPLSLRNRARQPAATGILPRRVGHDAMLMRRIHRDSVDRGEEEEVAARSVTQLKTNVEERRLGMRCSNRVDNDGMENVRTTDVLSCPSEGRALRRSWVAGDFAVAYQPWL